MASATADSLFDRARSSTGLNDFGPDHYREMLELWVADLARPVVSEFGRGILLAVAERNLALRLRLLQTYADNPEIADVPIPPIVFISGFARSGTTLLHTLLGLHPAARTLRRWELVAPLPPPESATWANDPRIAKVQASVERLRGSGLEEMHWIQAEDPEECTHGYYDCSGLMGRGVAAVTPSWWARLAYRDEQPTLLELRRLIQLLLWHNPPPPDAVLVLKNPTTAAHLREFAAAFPEATVLLCHRDPFRCATSICAIVDVIARPYLAAGLDARAAFPGMEQAMLDALEVQATRMLDFAASSSRCSHVRYSDLMDDPVSATAAALESVGLLVPSDWEQRVRGLLAWQRSGGRAAAPPSYEVGFGRDDMRARRGFVDYSAGFDVPEERERVTDPTG